MIWAKLRQIIELGKDAAPPQANATREPHAL